MHSTALVTAEGWAVTMGWASALSVLCWACIAPSEVRPPPTCMQGSEQQQPERDAAQGVERHDRFVELVSAAGHTASGATGWGLPVPGVGASAACVGAPTEVCSHSCNTPLVQGARGAIAAGITAAALLWVHLTACAGTR
jgi:hypothetical protein